MPLVQATKSLVYFFTEQKDVIYMAIFTSIFRCLPIVMMMMNILLKMMMMNLIMIVIMIFSYQPSRHPATAELYDQDCWPK